MTRLSADQLEEKLFLAMLRRSRAGEGNAFNLDTLCALERLDATPEELFAFVSENDAKFGRGNLTMKVINFSISAEGLRHAAEIENAIYKPTIADRLQTLPFGKGFWDLFKIIFGILLGVIATKMTGS